MLILILLVIFATVGMVSYITIPYVYYRSTIASERRKQRLQNDMEQIVPRSEAQKMTKVFFVIPPLLAFMGYFFFPSGLKFAGLIVGLVCGLIFPGMYIRFLAQNARKKFQDQLIDALMIMSSSFRGGLSLIQALEAVVEEMPDPIMTEISAVLGENKMGVSLEEAMYHLYKRMPTVALQQMITSILLARETGGNLPVIFSRIVTNIRENKKIQQNIDTLTLQGKIQGIVMAILPIAFGFIIFSANKRIFMHMLSSKMGQGLLTYAVISEVIGAIMIMKISSFKDF